ncbi:MAG: hypothetical protein LBT91_00275 [Bifidobacteriaceae bacterium]|nr:hypothetical protein [Bifidobacteriaceae bacterium]
MLTNRLFAKIGIYLSVLIVLFLSFAVGNLPTVLADSKNVLSIARGGTGSDESKAGFTNIFGNTFGNYNGTLPIKNGGTAATNAIGGLANINANPRRDLKYNGSWNDTIRWIKVADITSTTSTFSDEYTQTMRITGLTDINSNDDNSDYTLNISANHSIQASFNFSQTINMSNLSLNCQKDTPDAMWVSDVLTSTTWRLKVFIRRGDNFGVGAHIEYLNNIRGSNIDGRTGIRNFQEEYFETRPTGDYSGDIMQKCAQWEIKE